MSSVQVNQGGSGATGQAKEKVQEMAGQAQAQVQDAAGQAKSRLRDQVDQRSSQMGDQVKTTADDLRSVAEELRNRDKDQPARLAEQAASKIESFGQYLSESDGDRLLKDVEDLARRQPWAVVAVGAGLGLIASRFLKASSAQRYDSYYTSTRTRSQLRESVGTAVVVPETGSVGYPEPTAVPPAPPPSAYPSGTGVTTSVDPYGTTGTGSTSTSEL